MNEKFAKVKLVNASIYRGSSDNYEATKKEFLERIKPTGETHLFAYVEVEKDNKIQLQCFIECKNANSIGSAYIYNGLFECSEATKIVILSCGNNIKNMSWMFADCSSLTELKISSFNTQNVTDMSFIFYDCRKLSVLNLSNFNTDNVTNMSYMFNNCSSLTNLNLSNFNTQNVTNIGYIFYKCFKEEQPSTLICQASTIQKITNSGGSHLIIPNNNNDKINDKLNENLDQVYTCSVKRVGNNPEITDVEEYQSQK